MWLAVGADLRTKLWGGEEPLRFDISFIEANKLLVAYIRSVAHYVLSLKDDLIDKGQRTSLLIRAWICFPTQITIFFFDGAYHGKK